MPHKPQIASRSLLLFACDGVIRLALVVITFLVLPRVLMPMASINTIIYPTNMMSHPMLLLNQASQNV